MPEQAESNSGWRAVVRRRHQHSPRARIPQHTELRYLLRVLHEVAALANSIFSRESAARHTPSLDDDREEREEKDAFRIVLFGGVMRRVIDGCADIFGGDVDLFVLTRQHSCPRHVFASMGDAFRRAIALYAAQYPSLHGHVDTNVPGFLYAPFLCQCREDYIRYSTVSLMVPLALFTRGCRSGSIKVQLCGNVNDCELHTAFPCDVSTNALAVLINHERPRDSDDAFRMTSALRVEDEPYDECCFLPGWTNYFALYGAFLSTRALKQCTRFMTAPPIYYSPLSRFPVSTPDAKTMWMVAACHCAPESSKFSDQCRPFFATLGVADVALFVQSRMLPESSLGLATASSLMLRVATLRYNPGPRFHRSTKKLWHCMRVFSSQAIAKAAAKGAVSMLNVDKSYAHLRPVLQRLECDFVQDLRRALSIRHRAMRMLQNNYFTADEARASCRENELLVLGADARFAWLMRTLDIACRFITTD